MGLITWFAGAFASILGYSVVRFVAWKLVIWSIAVTIFPIILTNFVYKMIQNAMTLTANVHGQSNLTAAVIQFSGLAGWLAFHLRLVEGFSLLMSAIMFRLAMRYIPFLGLR